MTLQHASIELKLTKAKSLLAEVPILLENKFNITAINRLYYACYHATRALLLTKNIMPKTHKGVVIMLQKHFVLEKLLDEKYGALYSTLMEERMDDDYSDYLSVDEETIREFTLFANEYIPIIEILIKQHGSNK